MRTRNKDDLSRNIILSVFILILCGCISAAILLFIKDFYRNRRIEQAISAGKAAESRMMEYISEGIFCTDVINILCEDEWPDKIKMDMVSKKYVSDSRGSIRYVALFEENDLVYLYPGEARPDIFTELLKEGGELYRDVDYSCSKGIKHMSNSFSLLSGERLFAIIQPLPVNGSLKKGGTDRSGCALAILDMDMIVEKSGINDLRSEDYNYSLYKANAATGVTETISSFGSGYLIEPVRVDKLMPNGEEWHLLISMNGGWTTAAEKESCIFIAVLISVLIPFVVFLFLSLRSREKELKLLSYSDSLTKVRNTRAYSDALEELERLTEDYGIIYVDVNGFKRINDTYGHRTGDEILHITAERIGNTIRHDDILYRIGGDEFAVIIHGTHDEDFYKGVIARMKEAMIRKVSFQGNTIAVTISCGYARYPIDGTDPQSIIQVADSEMYKDKAAQKTGDSRDYFWFNHDVLTGLLNREGFYKAVALHLNEHQEKEHVMITSDIRNFKIINQLYGTGKGNDIILSEAKLLEKEFGEDGMICGRISGDRFAILMDEDHYDEERISDLMKDFEKNAMGNGYRMVVQLGVFRITDNDMSPAIMLDKTVMALKSVKSDTEFEVVYYDDEMMKDTLHENEVLNKFDNALKNNEFVMYLQPQVDRDGSLLGAEALARWISDGKVVSPSEFIPVLEKTNQIYKLDSFIWEEAAKKLNEWKGTSLDDMTISVNISPKDFYNIDIENTFKELQEKYEVDPGRLKLEITETAVMLDRSDGSQLVDRLKEQGFEVEMDDFGSGYSSLNMLKDIKIDVLKIDMGFLNKTDDEERAGVIIDSVITMAKKLGMTVIAEGVEEKRQMEFLSRMGCDIFQGFYFSRPMPAEKFEEEMME